MKRIIFILVAILTACFAYTQNTYRGDYHPYVPASPGIYTYATATTPLGRYVNPYDIIIVTAGHLIYQTTIAFGPTYTPATIASDGHYTNFTPASGSSFSVAIAVATSHLVTPYAVIAADSSTHIVATDIKFGNYFYGIGDSLKPTTTNHGFVGTPTKQVGSGYFHYITGDWGAFTRTTGTNSNFGADSCTNLIASTNVKALTGNINTLTSSSHIVTPYVTVTNDSTTNLVASGNMSVGGTFTVTGSSYTQGTIMLCTAPKAFDSTGTATAATMLRSVIKSNSASAVSMTTPSATSISALIPNAGQGTRLDLIIDNSGASASGVFTVVLDGSITVPSTVVITGENILTVAVGQEAKFTIYFSSASVAKIYRIF
jgi:hypothetical protein